MFSERVRDGRSVSGLRARVGLAAVGLAFLLASALLGQEKDPPEPAKASVAPAEGPHWAFQKPRRPAVPAVQRRDWVRTPVDAFILARLERAGLQPAPPASRAALLRRVTVDLTGLPPTPAELDDFLNDPRPDAYARVVERLLDSPRYGECWAQHWLDVVRYAESNGYEGDAERPHAWRYRDYVIRAFNDDKPYDRFVTEQLAGDLLWKDEGGRMRDERNSSLILPPSSFDLLVATGFNRCGPVHIVSGNTDPEVNRQEVLTEMTGAVGSTFLGLTVGCARCHDHKFDPFPQADYYRLQAFFAAAKPTEVDIASDAERRAYEQRVQALQAQMTPLRKQIAELENPYRNLLLEVKKAFLEPAYLEALDVPAAKRTPEQKKLAEHAAILIKVTWDELVRAMTPEDRARRAQWRTRLHVLEAQMPPPPAHAWSVADDLQVPPTFVLKRGDPKRKGKAVQPGFPEILGAEGRGDRKQSLNRLDLARWLTRPDHPLTARVLVNRLWQHHFGRGLVATANDFGLRGQRPSHPELLDWLSCEFVSHGWSVKHMHRLLVLSNTYQQASRSGEGRGARGEGRGKMKEASSSRAPRPAPLMVDPDNRLLWRMNRQRLEGESLRDSVLAVTGDLNAKMGGPMVRIPLEPEVLELIFTEGEPDGLWHVTPDPREHRRRSIYLFAKRNVRLPLFEAFDQPDTLTSCPVRPVSTFAPQALILLNGPFMQEQSKRFAAGLLRDCGTDADRLIGQAYRWALARAPRPREIDMARDFLRAQAELLRGRLARGEKIPVPPGVPPAADPARAAAVADFCLALLNCNEFLYVE